jgi:hypothetical protein
VRPLNLHSCAEPTCCHIENARIPASIRLWRVGARRIETGTSFRHSLPHVAGVRSASVGILLPLFDRVTLHSGGARRAISWDRRASWKN